MVQKPHKGVGSVPYLLHHSFATIFGGLSGVFRTCRGYGAQTLVFAHHALRACTVPHA
jgi:hypothetical protein